MNHVKLIGRSRGPEGSLTRGEDAMAVTPRAFSDALKSAMVVEMPLWLRLNDGREHRVHLPVLILEKNVEFAGPYVLDQRIVVAWSEVASLLVGAQGAVPHDKVTAAHDAVTSFNGISAFISRSFAYCADTAHQIWPLAVTYFSLRGTWRGPQGHERGLPQADH
jgi:hypothetical protein